jgi:multisubunit Na+/H+ antiporter MnhB subunit
MNVNVATAAMPPAKAGRGVMTVLGLAVAGALVFIGVAALPYFLRTDEAQFRQYWPMRGWLLVHIAMGMVAILSGPVQLWLGLSDRYPAVHRNLGFVYMAAVTLGAVAGYYLAFSTSGGVVFGSGLAGLATAWLMTTGLAFLAIKRHLYEQHKEWMIRSYVVTFAFVTFRAFDTLIESRMPLLDHIGISAWFCWSVPLLLNEVVLQGRKILRVKV